MKSIESIMKSKLDERLQQGNKRSLQTFEGYVDFLSNDYLSLSAIQTPDYVKTKPGSSRLIAGTTPLLLELEQKCAEFFDGVSALHFNSGYAANLGVLSCIPQRGNVVIYDERAHASIIDGMRLSLTQRVKFEHNNTEDLKKKLTQHKESTCFVVVEGLYSMDGDLAPLKEIDSLCKAFGANLIVDEAHSGGVYGRNGKGYCAKEGIAPFLRIFTFGKAFGSHGACVVGSQLTIDYLINFSRTFIYTTALDEQTVGRTLYLLKNIDFQKQQNKLAEVIKKFNQLFPNLDCTSHADSPIKILPFSDRKELKSIEMKLHQSKIGVKAIYAPTVPEDKECLRISLHADNTTKEIEYLYSKIYGKNEIL